MLFSKLVNKYAYSQFSTFKSTVPAWYDRGVSEEFVFCLKGKETDIKHYRGKLSTHIKYILNKQ